MGKVAFPLLLPLAVAALGASSHAACLLTGSWRNDLGSNMTISAVDSTGAFSGQYLTAVSATPRRILVSPLIGFQHPENETVQPTFGFSVKWMFSNSTTVFVGQCFRNAPGQEFLKTMWLLREGVESPENDWKTTRVGTNLFIRNGGDSERRDGAQ